MVGCGENWPVVTERKDMYSLIREYPDDLWDASFYIDYRDEEDEEEVQPVRQLIGPRHNVKGPISCRTLSD